MSSNKSPTERARDCMIPSSLLHPDSLFHMELAMVDGAEKYGAFDWASPEHGSGRGDVNKAVGHIEHWRNGARREDASGQFHLAHAASRLVIALFKDIRRHEPSILTAPVVPYTVTFHGVEDRKILVRAPHDPFSDHAVTFRGRCTRQSVLEVYENLVAALPYHEVKLELS